MMLLLVLACVTVIATADDNNVRPSSAAAPPAAPSAGASAVAASSVNREQQRQLWIQLNSNNNEAGRKQRRKPIAVTINTGVALDNTPQLRPSMSLAGNPTPLEMLVMNEDRDPSLDPKPAAIEQAKLQRLLGDNYDHEMMSVLRPAESSLRPNGTIGLGIGGLRAARDRPDVNVAAFEMLRNRLQIGKKQARKLEKLLVAYTDCPVVYVWLDLGVRFWPRWFREARCYQDRVKSCSIPAGMQCMPNGYTNKTILRYHCRNESRKKAKRCQWIPVTVPLITSCSCGCSDRQDGM